MAVCDRYGIAHSEFLGWDVDDRDKAIWWLIRERQTCRSCGTREAEWDPEQGGDHRAYVATRHTCPGCQRLEIHREQFGQDAPHGVRFRLTRPKPRGDAGAKS